MENSVQKRDDELIALIGRCAIRDQAALKALFTLAGPYLNAIIYRILRSNELAADVLQEAFIQIWKNASSYRPHLASPLTWLSSIARYRALDRLDREQRYNAQFVQHQFTEDTEPLTDEHNPEKLAMSRQLNFHLHRCLATLGENIKHSIELAYLYGHSREEIAVRFDANTNTVKSWLHRGAERLKQCMESV